MRRHSSSDWDFDALPRVDPPDDGSDVVDALLNARPRGGEQHDDSQASAREILLVAEALICRHQYVIAVRLGMVEQRAIAQIRPPTLEGGIHRVFGQMPTERRRRALIEEYFHVTDSFRS